MLVSFSWFLFQFDVFVGAKHFLYSAFTVKKIKIDVYTMNLIMVELIFVVMFLTPSISNAEE